VRKISKFSGAFWLGVCVLSACSSGRKDAGGPGGSAGSPALDAGPGADASNPFEPLPSGGSGPYSGQDAAVPSDPCEALSCGDGQRCVKEAGSAQCMDVACDALMCSATEKCVEHAQGGHVCEDNSCSGDVQCGAAEYCKAGACASDVCSAGTRRCDGQKLYECAANGGEDILRFSCPSDSHFTSSCSAAAGAGSAACSCQDDWNCPAHTVCETGTCQGTGAAPSCNLPPVPFSATPPNVELFWGGTSPSSNAAHDGTAAAPLAPWSDFGQVLDTPIVANLDDDNGDGLVNELDFPEILFVSHKGDNPWSNGIVRAIHGGGPKKGADYFARCGTQLWTEGMAAPGACADATPDADSGAPLAVGDLDGDGLPEIVYTTENNLFRILDHTGALLYSHTTAYALNGDGDSPSIANLDGSGYAEIILGRVVYVLGSAAGGGITVTHILTGSGAKGTNGPVDSQVGTMACVADVLPDQPGLEIVAGATLYKLPASLPSCGTPPCTGALDTVWNGPSVAGNTGLSGEGYCAIADVWGADPAQKPGPSNRPDGKPEVILIDNGDLIILDAATGKIILDRNLGGGTRGGAPNVDDFDGDGFMEVASALSDFYIVADLQASTGAAGSCPDWPGLIARKDQANGAHNPNPARAPGASCKKDSDCDAAAVCNVTSGQCVCLHNGWKRDSDDDSSKVTSSSVFDFNGDGSAEAIYNDECDFRVYDGASGEVLFSQPSRSRTGIENPVVADVDNDGNAEVVTGMNTAVNGRCDDDPGGVPTGPNGLRVWGDPTDTWVSARRIWNQQSYHVTNVTEGAELMSHEPESWKTWNGRTYNTYRSQPRSYGVAPDLTVVGVGISSPDAKCGSLSDNLDIAFEILNAGDLRVGPGVIVSFHGTWNGSEEPLKGGDGMPLKVTLTQSLEPGKSTILKASFMKSWNGKDALPSHVRVVVDPANGSQPNGAERECRENNNDKKATVDGGALRADLSVDIQSVSLECPNAKVSIKVRNAGTATAEPVVVRFYAGDPAQGGSMLKDETLPGALEPNAEVSLVVSLAALPDRGAIRIFAVVDPAKAVSECDEANNRDAAPNDVLCDITPQ